MAQRVSRDGRAARARRRSTAKRVVIVCAVLVALIAGYLVADIADVVPGVLTAAPPRPAPKPFPVPPDLEPQAAPVLAGLSEDAPVPGSTEVAQRLEPLLGDKSLGPHLGVEVRDGITGDQLFGKDQGGGYLPASTTKLFTATAALTILGPETTLKTTVVAGPGPDEITLVGGGDMLLAAGKSAPGQVDGAAGLADLAAKTAAALKAEGRTEVAVRLDDTLYSGPAVSPEWADDDVSNGEVAPIAPLMVDVGQEKAGERVPRAPDPAMWATDRFATALGKDGVEVLGKPARSAAQAKAKQLARVESAPIRDVVGYMLEHSDNTVAECLGRLVAVATDRSGSFLDAADAVLAGVADAGIDVGNVKLKDVSGLSHNNRITPKALTDVVLLAAGGTNPELGSLLSSLPIAGLTGTLAPRFQSGGARPGAGLVRAKTGSLGGVSALAGTVTDASGRLLVFALMADSIPPEGAAAAPGALDHIAASLAGCGCSTG